MDNEPHPRIFLPTLFVSIVLFVGVFWAYNTAKDREESIVLPGGITYLGPSPTQKTENREQRTDGKIPVPKDAKWVERKGQTLPYTFEYPETLSLGVFPNDPYDSVTVFYEGTDANANIFFRVDNLNTLGKTHYIKNPEEYARNWWRDYAWNGVSGITTFTNKQGLTGYRASYLTSDNTTTYDHVFFEVPDRNDLIIWMSGKLFERDVFDRMVNSVTWKR